MSKFSVGYNGTDVDEFLEILKPYGDKIESIFFGHPNVPAHHKMDMVTNYKNAVDRFIDTKMPYKKMLAFNNIVVSNRTKELTENIKDNIFPLIEAEKIDGVIVGDYYNGKFLRESFPELIIDTSCNTFMYSIREMNIWKENIRVNYFNPPREILRMPEKLKEMHNSGFKLKCIVNESCLFGCVNSLHHQVMMSSTKSESEIHKEEGCCMGDVSNFFRSNWVLPRWIPKLEKYVDVFKISSRHLSNEMLKNTLDCYINEKDDANIALITVSGTHAVMIQNGFVPFIPTSEIPDTLLTCECKRCRKNCTICDELAEKFLLGGKCEHINK